MTARGVEFLNEWVSGKLPPMPIGDSSLVKALVQKMRDDAGDAGFTLVDLGIDESQVEQFIRETLAHIAKPGTTGTE